MKRYLVEKPCQGHVEEMDEPERVPNEELVEPLYVGLCGSDKQLWRGNMPLASYPRVPGHEVVVRGAGFGAAIVNPYTACGQCTPCRRKRENTCERNQTLGVQR